MTTSTGPSFNVVIANRFLSIKGKENLKAYKLRDNSKSTMLIVNCCKACVAIFHEGLAPKVLIIPADVSVI